ncbi:DUF3310 domain-containing protein [Streptomyces sp. NPDC020489]|uniref:DUF3310 domain-containing protein n=1 Tax=Streptomyces sp. NPDC020489 TaxID=3365077 RepID=UPI0037B8D543
MTDQPTTHGPVEWTPNHYRGNGLQPFDVINAFDLDFYEGNALKYLLRWRKKNGVEDLCKARTYVQILIDRAEQAAVDGSEAHSAVVVHHLAKPQASRPDGVDEEAPEPTICRPVDGEDADVALGHLLRDLAAALADYPVAAWTPSNLAGRALRVMRPELERLRATEAAIERVSALADQWASAGQDPNARIGMDAAAEAIVTALSEQRAPAAIEPDRCCGRLAFEVCIHDVMPTGAALAPARTEVQRVTDTQPQEQPCTAESSPQKSPAPSPPEATPTP